MITALVFLIVLASVPLAGGRLTRLADLPLRAPGLAVAAILVQVVVISVLPGGSHTLHTGLHIASYLLLGAFAVANRRIAGVPLITIGGALNFVAILANGGVMPASKHAIASFGHQAAKGDFENSQVLAHPHLQFLGDIIAIPSSWPLHNVFSVGDVISFIGVILLVHVACRTRLVPRRFAARAARPAAVTA